MLCTRKDVAKHNSARKQEESFHILQITESVHDTREGKPKRSVLSCSYNLWEFHKWCIFLHRFSWDQQIFIHSDDIVYKIRVFFYSFLMKKTQTNGNQYYCIVSRSMWTVAAFPRFFLHTPPPRLWSKTTVGCFHSVFRVIIHRVKKGRPISSVAFG